VKLLMQGNSIVKEAIQSSCTCRKFYFLHNFGLVVLGGFFFWGGGLFENTASNFL